ncbi:hypothetical protein KO507_10945 [Gilvimarinus agarilyticus]|uniref:hypothetical protein n=1 Tax=unclassified Gilvimarinus TaxID=2642066 RepID=UPI001C081E07|nr:MULTISPECIES: hypothetical protein [unclassified Gilvimarinus]MBU2886280.1 hypothetical protein [Gilvimarinus agarilyticus]MDO6570966.1 hypothetical protein [Gilvimarinus sp. 2_MG-2023]MDO6747747.1 hypothetical protein [Gilvimarinus sp. 1_MG-2023]
MSSNTNKIDPQELLFTLDQLEQTTEIMGRVVSRLKRQLTLVQEARQTAATPAAEPKPPRTKPRRILH